MYMLIILYLVLFALGFKSTWKLVSDTILAGSSEIVFAIILFILLVLVIGPFMGIINIVKYLINKLEKNKNDQNL